MMARIGILRALNRNVETRPRPRLGSARRGCAQAALTHGADEHDPTSVIRGRIVGSKIRDGRRYRA